MAEIFRAKQLGARGFEKIVVIKRILHHLSEDPEFVAMFEDEAKIAAQLNHANIVQIYELGEVESQLYITMEYVEGKNLRDLTRAIQGKNLHLSVEQSLYVVSEVLKGLDYAHRKTDSQGQALEIIHRDMSPQNVILSYEGEVKILDFGIAKAASKISRTEAGVLKGKFSYMSPEQASGSPIDQRSDLFACGVILYELLTSERLFRADTDTETLDRVRKGIVPKPSEKNRHVDEDLDQIVLKILDREPDRRYQTAQEILSAIQSYTSSRGMTYGSHDLAVFMRTCFQGNIEEERANLRAALEQVPSHIPPEVKGVQTHIAFKSPELDSADEDTHERAKHSPGGKVKRTSSFLKWATGFLFLITIGLFLWTYKLDLERNPPQDDPPKQIVITPKEPEESAPAEKQVSTDEPVPAKEPTPKETETQPEAENNPNIPIFDELQIPDVKQQRPQSPPPPQSKKYGRIDLIAPVEGSAIVFIDDEELGEVPGPKARGIKLEVGEHDLRCETKNFTYQGTISVQEGQRESIRCQELIQNEP